MSEPRDDIAIAKDCVIAAVRELLSEGGRIPKQEDFTIIRDREFLALAEALDEYDNMVAERKAEAQDAAAARFVADLKREVRK